MASSCTAVLPPLDGTVLLSDCVDFNARHNPLLPVYIFASDDRTQVTEITYLEFGRAADRAALLFRRTFGSHERRTVAILAMADVLVYQTVLMGCLRAGLVPFPISPRLPASSIAHLLHVSSCTQLIATRASLASLIQDTNAAYANIVPDACLLVEEAPSLNDIYPMLGRETSCDAYMPQTAYASPGLADIALFLHSSGSTGLPKAIPISHEVIVKRLSFPDTTELRSHKPDIRFAGMALPPFHQLGLAVQMFNLMYTVKSVALYPPIVSSTNAWPMVPTTENVLSHAKLTKVNAMATVPSYLEVWAQSMDDVEFLSQMEFVAFAGGALPSSVGNQLVEAGVKLRSMYGATEVGGPTYMISAGASSSDWEWLRFGESIDIRWADCGDDMFELQFLTSHKHAYPIENLPDVRGYATSDLWRKHPNKPGLWQFAGRLDDVITLSTGEKVIPIPMENQLAENAHIRSALLFGQQRHQLGLLVEPEGEVQDSSEFIETIWPTIDRANKSAPAFARVFKDMVIVAGRGRQFIRSPKGTVVRKLTLAMYAEEIGRLYSTFQQEQGIHVAPKSLELSELVKWLTANVVELVSTDVIDPYQDLFQQGVDSVIAILLRNRIIRMCSHFPSAPRSLQLNVVANHPTVYLLATHIIANSTINLRTATTLSSSAQIEAMINTYSPSIRVNAERKANSNALVILLTGSTGSLGSHLLASLIEDPTVSRVYALNRPSGIPAFARQRASFQLHGMDVSIPGDKVVFLESPYQNHQLGLSPDLYEEIRRTCTLIIHNGWMLDFNLNLHSFEENIKATRELVNLGTSTHYKSRFIFISSVSAVFCEPGMNGARTGYGESKYVAEQLIACSGLDSVSLRFGQLCGDRTAGVWSTKEWFPLVVKSALTMGCLPKSLGVIRWLSVDAAASIVRGIAQSQTSSRVFNIEHPHPLDGPTLTEYVRSSLVRHRGVQIRTIPLSEWIDIAENRMLVASHDDIAEMPVLKILQFMRVLLKQADDTVSLPDQNLIGNELDNLISSIGCITEEDVGGWVRYWSRLGFI